MYNERNFNLLKRYHVAKIMLNLFTAKEYKTKVSDDK